jgi:hypothetical protein
VSRLAKRGGNSIPRFLARNTFDLPQIRRCEPLFLTTLAPVKSVNSARPVNFGCKVNLHNTPVLREALLCRDLSEQKEDCDRLVVNTGTVTAQAARKPRQLIRRAFREQPITWISPTGYPTEYEPEISEGSSGLPGHSQRVQVDPSLIDGPCPRVRASTHRKKTADSTAEKPAHKVVLHGIPSWGNLSQGNPIQSDPIQEAAAL